MPHRIIETPFGTIIEAVLLSAAMGYQLTKSAVIAFTEQDWSRLMGPQGFTVGLLLAVVVLWGNGVMRERNESKRREVEEKAREARHKESMDLQRGNSEKLTQLTVEGILAQGKFTIAMNSLVSSLNTRPCAMSKPIPPFTFDVKPKDPEPES